MDAKDIILPVAAVATITTGSGAAAHASNQYDSSLNHAATWGSSCVKKDMTGEVMTYTPQIDSDKIEKVIVKGGTENAIYTTAPFVDLTAPVNPKNGKPYAISHVIVCTKDGTAVQANVQAGSGSTAAPASSYAANTAEVLADESVQPAIPTGKGTATELPKTGAGVGAAVTVGAGALTYAGARAASRKLRKLVQ